MMLIIRSSRAISDDLDIVEAMARSGPALGVTCTSALASVRCCPMVRRRWSPSARGFAEWRAVASDVTPGQVTITTTARGTCYTRHSQAWRTEKEAL